MTFFRPVDIGKVRCPECECPMVAVEFTVVGVPSLVDNGNWYATSDFQPSEPGLAICNRCNHTGPTSDFAHEDH